MSKCTIKRGCPHLHKFVFCIDSDNNMKEINANKRPSVGSVYGKKMEYEIGITRSEYSTNMRVGLNIVVYFSQDCDETKVVLSACARGLTHIDNEYIKQIVSNLNVDNLFKPLQLRERMYRCLIPGTHGVPVHVFKTYSARTIQYPNIEHV